MPTDNLYPVPVKTQANGHILVQDGATRGATIGVNLYDEQGNLVPPENLDARAIVAAHRTEANAHPISSITNLQTSLDAKVNRAGDTMSGQLNASFNVPAIGAGSYADRQYRAETTDGSYPGYGFHISGFAGAALYYTGGLNLSITDNTNTTANLWHSQNLAQPMTLNTEQTVTGYKTFANGEINVQGFAGDANSGVVRFGSDTANNYIWKTGNTFRFKAGANAEVVLNSNGGDILTTVNNPNWNAVNNGGRLGTAAMFVPGDNWNNAIDNGWYMASGAANAPTATVWYIGIVTKHNDLWITQEVWDFTLGPDAPRYRRTMLNGTWGAWSPRLVLDGHLAATSRVMACDGPLDTPPQKAMIQLLYISGAAGDKGVLSAYNYATSVYKPVQIEASYLSFAPNGGAVKFSVDAEGRVDAQDFYAVRPAAPTTGAIFLGNQASAARYLFYNGTNYIMPGADLYTNGGRLGSQVHPSGSNNAHFSGNGTGLQMNGAMYENGTTYNLAADGAVWVRNPRTFVQSTDPGAQASDGDLWFW